MSIMTHRISRQQKKLEKKFKLTRNLQGFLHWLKHYKALDQNLYDYEHDTESRKWPFEIIKNEEVEIDLTIKRPSLYDTETEHKATVYTFHHEGNRYSIMYHYDSIFYPKEHYIEVTENNDLVFRSCIDSSLLISRVRLFIFVVSHEWYKLLLKKIKMFEEELSFIIREEKIKQQIYADQLEKIHREKIRRRFAA